MAKTPNIDLREEYGRNYLINGNFDFWQRGTSLVLTPGGGNRIYDADRWSATNFFNTGQITVSRDTDVPSQAVGALYSRKMLIDTTVTLSNSSHYAATHYAFEGNMIRPLIGKKVTLVFWAKASLIGDFSIGISAGNPDASTDRYLTKYTINTANTWEMKSISFYMDPTKSFTKDTSLGLNITFGIAGNSNVRNATADTWLASSDAYILTAANRTDMLAAGNSLKLSQVMLVDGTGDISFRTAGKDHAEELALCQRYFEKSYNIDIPPGSNTEAGALYGYSNAATSVRLTAFFVVTKRATPTCHPYSTPGALDKVRSDSSIDYGAFASNQGINSFAIQNSVSTEVGIGMRCQWTADAEL